MPLWLAGTGHAPPEREVLGYKVGPETVVHQDAGGKRHDRRQLHRRVRDDRADRAVLECLPHRFRPVMGRTCHQAEEIGAAETPARLEESILPELLLRLAIDAVSFRISGQLPAVGLE